MLGRTVADADAVERVRTAYHHDPAGFADEALGGAVLGAAIVPLPGLLIGLTMTLGRVQDHRVGARSQG